MIAGDTYARKSSQTSRAGMASVPVGESEGSSAEPPSSCPQVGPVPTTHTLSCRCLPSRLRWCHPLEGLHYSQRGPAFGCLRWNHPVRAIGHRSKGTALRAEDQIERGRVKTKNDETTFQGLVT